MPAAYSVLGSSYFPPGGVIQTLSIDVKTVRADGLERESALAHSPSRLHSNGTSNNNILTMSEEVCPPMIRGIRRHPRLKFLRTEDPDSTPGRLPSTTTVLTGFPSSSYHLVNLLL